jgi:hypothetical protein
MNDRKPGLKSVYQARADRERGKFSRVTANATLAAAGVFVGSIVLYEVIAGRQLDEAKASLLAKQHAVAATVGKEWYPLRDRIEKATLDAAAHYDGDRLEEAAAHWDFRSLPGLYLRMRAAEVKDVASLRKGAEGSLRDGFVACLLHEPNTGAAKGDPDAGAFAEQPWNWQKAYAATRVLTDDWVTQVKNAESPIRLRIFEQQYEKATAEEIPAAIDILQRAQFFLLVLDEDSDKVETPGGAPPTEEALQSVGHFARVHLLRLEDGREVLRVRRNAEASFMFAGERPVTDPETLEAMKRQVNNCALARAVEASLDGGAPDSRR